MGPLCIPVIMCGGAGTRVWPESRETLPKQFIPLVGEQSTFQRIIAMISDPSVFEKPVVITNRAYRFLVAEQLAELGVAATIVLEPERRDSGPAVAAAAELASIPADGRYLVEHPSGATEVLIETDGAGRMVAAGTLRTARKLFDGRVFPRA